MYPPLLISFTNHIHIGVAAGPAGPAIAGPIFCLQAAPPWSLRSVSSLASTDERRSSTHARRQQTEIERP